MKIINPCKNGFFIFLLSCFMLGNTAHADNVAMVETMKFLAPETVNLIIARAQNGGPYGFQVGDTIKYIVKYKPVPNGGNTGVNGYITDYIPSGLQVIGAGFSQPDGFGGYVDVPPFPAGDMANTPEGNGQRFAVALSPLLPATPVNIAVEVGAGQGGPADQGTMAQLYADVGVWYSTDLRTAYNAGAAGASRNAWDLDQVIYDDNGNLSCTTNGGADGPWGTGSPIAGPETYYQHEIDTATCLTGPVGPWHRIAVSGSRIGVAGLLGDLQASRELLAGDPLYGRDVLASPLPVATATTPVTIRWANGLNSVGEIKYVNVTARIASLPPGGTIINNSEVWGGDVFYGEGGKDNAWKYNDTLVSVGNNSDMVILKTPNMEAANVGESVSFQITIINTGAKTHNNIQVVDYLNASHEPGAPGVLALMVTYNMDASGGGLYCAGALGVVAPIPVDTTLCSVGGSERLVWNVALLNPGDSQTFTYSVTALTPPDPKILSASDVVTAISDQMPAPGASAGASFEVGAFPFLTQSKTVTPSTILAGDTVRYHVQIINTGSGDAGVWVDPVTLIAYAPFDVNGLAIPTTITDTLPAGFTYAGNSVLTIHGMPTLATVTAAGNTITWTISHGLAAAAGINGIPYNAILDLYFDAKADPNLTAGIYTNTVYTTSPFNNDPGGNIPPKDKDWGLKPLWSINTAAVTVGAVQLSKTATPTSVENTVTGTSTSYSITITNDGAIAATDVVVSDTLPTGFSYQSGSTSGTAAIAEPSIAGQVVTWPVFDVPATSSLTVIFNANIASTVLAAVYHNDVTATSTNTTIPDLLQTASVVVTSPGLSISKSVDQPFIVWQGDGIIAAPFPNEVINYTISATNTGTASSIIEISDQLPIGLEYDPLLGNETVLLTVSGVTTTLIRTIDYQTFPVLLSTTPNWGTFTIPPKIGVDNSVLSITFPVRVNMAETPGLLNAIRASGSYDNSLTVAGNVAIPAFIGAPITLYHPVITSTTTPNVSVNGTIDYRFHVINADNYTWSGVSVVDYLGALTTAGIAPAVPSGAVFNVGTGYYAIGSTAPTGVPGVDIAWLSTTPISAAPNLTFDNLGAGFTILADQSLFVAFSATAPATVPVPAIVHNSIQTLNYTSNTVAKMISSAYDGGLSAHVGENITITATPTVDLSSTKMVSPAYLYLYGVAAANALTYTITMTNNDVLTAATGGITIIDTLAVGITADPAAGATTFVDLYSAAGVFISTTAIVGVWNAALNQLSITVPAGISIAPLGGYANIRFTASVTALTAANTYYNSATWTGVNVNAGTVGPAAPLSIDPVTVSKQALTPSAVAGGTAAYRITVSNSGDQILQPFSLTDTFGNVVPALASGFLYSSDIALSLNGTALTAPADYTVLAGAGTAPVWTLGVPMPAGTASTASTLVIDFYATVPAATVAGTYNNSVSNLSFTPGVLAAVVALNPFDGGGVSNTSDDVTVASVGITKSVVNPYSTVTNDPVLGAITQYQIIVANTSGAIQTVNVVDTLATGFSFAAGTAYVATGATPPVASPPSAGWTLTTPVTVLPQTVSTPLFDNAAAGFVIPANQNLYIFFTAAVSSTISPGTYNNQADVRLTAAPTIVVGSVNSAPVTVSSPQAFISKITTTLNIGKDIYGAYSLAHYKLTVTNTGTADATGVVLSDTLPLNFALSGTPTIAINGVNQAAGSFSATPVGGQVITFDTSPTGGFTVPAATGGSNGLLVVDYDVLIANAVIAGAYNNDVYATTTNAGRLPLNAIDDPYAIVTLHDVGLSKTAASATATSGSTTSYTITVTSQTAINNVVVSDYLPTGFTYVLGSTLIDGVVAADPNLVNGNGLPIWTLNTLAAIGGGNSTIAFSVDIASTVSDTTYYNSVVATHGIAPAIVSFPNIGPTAPISIQSTQPLLAITKVANAANATSGDNIVYTLNISNTGSGLATSVSLTDALGNYTKLALDPFANATIFSFTDGANASGLAGTGTVSYSNNNGTTFAHTPTDDGSGHDPAITDFKIVMDGTMNTNVAANPSFQIQYQVQVK